MEVLKKVCIKICNFTGIAFDYIGRFFNWSSIKLTNVGKDVIVSVSNSIGTDDPKPPTGD